MSPLLLIASWNDGLTVIENGSPRHELAGHSVRGLGPHRGGALAIVDQHELRLRDRSGHWSELARHEAPLSCCLSTEDGLLVGTDDARLLRLRGSTLEELPGFAEAPDRDRWYAGSIVIDGQVLGPPLGVRSMSRTAAGALLVNVHVGGIPRSQDDGHSFRPSIDIDADVHEVRAHPDRADLVVAATARGLARSHDGGAHWKLQHGGLHASYCSAVAITGDHILLAASDDHFSERGALYRTTFDSDAPLERAPGLPDWLDGIVDTQCIATRGPDRLIATQGGTLHHSTTGHEWSTLPSRVPNPSSTLIL